MRPTIALFALLTCVLLPSALLADYPGDFSGYQLDGSALVIQTNTGDLLLKFVREDIVSVEYIHSEYTGEDSSLAVVPGHDEPIAASVTETSTTLSFGVGALTVVAEKYPVRLGFYRDGLPLAAEPASGGIGVDSYMRLAAWEVDPAESFYGTGEHNEQFDLSGQQIENNNVQHGGYTGRTNIMNISVPVLLSSDNWGVFVDNPTYGHWDIKDSASDQVTYVSYTGEMKYFFFAGESMPGLVEAYTWLTGRQPMPPRWALGFLQSRFGYENEEQARAVVDSLRTYEIPVDGLILDLYWFENMGDFGWDFDAFPEPTQMISDLDSMGVKTILINEPYITNQSENYSFLYSFNDWVGKTPGGDPYLVGWWWCPDCGGCDCQAMLLDMSNPAARDWYKQEAYDQLTDGIGGLWTDLGEPENHPLDMVHYAGTQNDVHNSFNLYWAGTVAEAFAEERPNGRIVNLTRSGSAGIQRYGVFTWSGDVLAVWDAFAGQPGFILQMGLSGIAYHSSDLGGFSGPENADLYTRWLAQGALSPVMRAHGVNKPTEPFAYDQQHRDWNRQIIELRYRLLPYIYTLAWENHQTGMPLVRPLFFEDPDRFGDEDTAYLFGDRLLVAPVMTEGAVSRNVPLPAGFWVDFRTDQRYAGPGDPTISSPFGSIPLLAKGGSLLPMSPVRQNTREMNLDTLIVHTFPAETGSDEFVLYEDDGISLDYQSGSYSELPMEADWSPGSHMIAIGPRSGSFDGMLDQRTFLVDMHGVVESPGAVTLDGQPLAASGSLADMRSSDGAWYYDGNRDHLWAQYSSDMSEQSVLAVDGYVMGVATQASLPDAFEISSLYPNPFNSRARVTITLPEAGNLRVEVYDITGRLVRTLASGRREAGVHRVSFIGDNLASGTYFVLAQFSGKTVQRKLTLIK